MATPSFFQSSQCRSLAGEHIPFPWHGNAFPEACHIFLIIGMNTKSLVSQLPVCCKTQIRKRWADIGKSSIPVGRTHSGPELPFSIEFSELYVCDSCKWLFGWNKKTPCVDVHSLALAALAIMAQCGVCSLCLGVRFDSFEISEPGPCWSGIRGPSDKEPETGKIARWRTSSEKTQKQVAEGQIKNDASGNSWHLLSTLDTIGTGQVLSNSPQRPVRWILLVSRSIL